METQYYHLLFEKRYLKLKFYFKSMMASQTFHEKLVKEV